MREYQLLLKDYIWKAKAPWGRVLLPINQRWLGVLWRRTWDGGWCVSMGWLNYMSLMGSLLR